VTGLGGRPIGSWQAGNSMWLRDWLGQDLQNRECGARIFTYGYPSKLVEGGRDITLNEYALRFLMSLVDAREKQFKVPFVIGKQMSHLTKTRFKQAGLSRPLILIGHSFGGLVIKQVSGSLSFYAVLASGLTVHAQALNIAHRSQELGRRDILDSCICLAMFGVPNLGLDNECFLDMTMGQENHELVRTLGQRSHSLKQLDGETRDVVATRDILTIAVYETMKTKTFVVRV
jgi:hypothetical protein